MTTQIEAFPIAQAAEIITAHIGLNYDHHVQVFACPGCGEPNGAFCLACREPLCAITNTECDHG